MKVIIAKNYQELSEITADLVIRMVKEKPNMLFCLPAGGSPIGMYEVLVNRFHNKEVSFKDMITFDMDEYVGISPENENSYAYFMQKHFLKYVDVDPKNVYYPDGLSPDIEAMCKAYSNKIFQMGGLDLAITGIGDDGHVAFNEPNQYLLPRTHVVDLKESTIQANARFFSSIEEVPLRAVSIGMEDIMRTKTFIVVASGKKKAPLLQKLFETDHIDPMYPVSFTRMHPNAIIILDEEAASLIPSEILKEYME